MRLLCRAIGRREAAAAAVLVDCRATEQHQWYVVGRFAATAVAAAVAVTACLSEHDGGKTLAAAVAIA